MLVERLSNRAFVTFGKPQSTHPRPAGAWQREQCAVSDWPQWVVAVTLPPLVDCGLLPSDGCADAAELATLGETATSVEIKRDQLSFTSA